MVTKIDRGISSSRTKSDRPVNSLANFGVPGANADRSGIVMPYLNYRFRALIRRPILDPAVAYDLCRASRSVSITEGIVVWTLFAEPKTKDVIHRLVGRPISLTVEYGNDGKFGESYEYVIDAPTFETDFSYDGSGEARSIRLRGAGRIVLPTKLAVD